MLTVGVYWESRPISGQNDTDNTISHPWNRVLAVAKACDEQQITLIDKDHVYLGITVDRSLLPTSSISAAEDWLDVISNDMQRETYDNGNVKIFYVDKNGLLCLLVVRDGWYSLTSPFDVPMP